MRVTEKMLHSEAEEIQSKLQEEGVNVHVSSYFAYGAYGYYINIFHKNDANNCVKQYYTQLGTKRECLEALKSLKYKVLYECTMTELKNKIR
jgi:hypothetical protein